MKTYTMPTIRASIVAQTTAALIDDAQAIIAEHPGAPILYGMHTAYRAWVASLMTMEGGDDTATQMQWINSVWRDLIANGYDLEA